MASSFVRAAFASRLRNYWSTTPIYLNGRRAVNGQGAIVDPESISLPLDPVEAGIAHLFLEFPLGDETQETIGDPGSNMHREEGVARIVYVLPTGSNVETAVSALDTMRANFRSVRFGTDDAIVTFGVDPPTEPYYTGNTYEIAVAVPYWRWLVG